MVDIHVDPLAFSGICMKHCQNKCHETKIKILPMILDLDKVPAI